MKKLLFYLIIIFYSSLTSSFSEDISDFQIEGISVDNSVHDFFTEKTLNKTTKKRIKTRSSYSYNSSYGEAEASENLKEGNISHDSFETYDNVNVVYFSDTTIIKSVTGTKYFEENNCNEQQKEAVNDLSKILEGSYKLDKKKHSVSKEIRLNQASFALDSGGSIVIQCYDNNKVKNDIKWVSALMLTINSKGVKKTKAEGNIKSPDKIIKPNSPFIQRQDPIGSRIKF